MNIDYLRLIGKEFGIDKIIQIVPGDEYCKMNGEENYINKSCIIGGDEIHLGIYEDKELWLASFFHELGHKVSSGDEFSAWTAGFRLAEIHGYSFSNNTYIWAINQIKSYY